MGGEGSPRDGRRRWGEAAPGEAVTVARSRRDDDDESAGCAKKIGRLGAVREGERGETTSREKTAGAGRVMSSRASPRRGRSRRQETRMPRAGRRGRVRLAAGMRLGARVGGARAAARAGERARAGRARGPARMRLGRWAGAVCCCLGRERAGELGCAGAPGRAGTANGERARRALGWGRGAATGLRERACWAERVGGGAARARWAARRAGPWDTKRVAGRPRGALLGRAGPARGEALAWWAGLASWAG
jgi:hypothetical protein